MRSHASFRHRAAALVASGTLALCCSACSTGTSDKVPTSTARSSGSTGNTSSTVVGPITFDCSGPIDTSRTVDSAFQNVLGTVGLRTNTTIGSGPGGSADPHRLFAKTGLILHAERAATLSIPKAWADKVSIAWGNHSAEWTTTLQIRACPTPPGSAGQWLGYPGGFSLDQPACVPLEVSTPTGKTVVQVPVGVPCPA